MVREITSKGRKITLQSDTSNIEAKHFRIDTFDNEESLVLRLEERAFLDSSFFYTLFDEQLEQLPVIVESEKADNYRDYLLTEDSFLILGERGSGTNVEFEVYSGEIERKNDIIVVTIRLEELEKHEELLASYSSKGFTTADMMNERVHELREGCDQVAQRRLALLNESNFINLQNNQVKVGLEFNTRNEFKLDLSEGWIHLEILRSDIAADYPVLIHTLQVGDILYKKHDTIRNRIDIVAVRGFVKDFHGNFYALCDRIYQYPRDAKEIQKAYPNFAERYCVSEHVYDKRKLLKDVKLIPYLLTNHILGDSVIHQRVETELAGEIVTPIDMFHMVTDGHGKYYGSLTLAGRQHLRLNAEDSITFATLMECERRFRLVYYRLRRFVSYNNEVYVEAVFNRASEWFDSISEDELSDFAARDQFKDRLVLRHFVKLLAAGNIKPIQLPEKKKLPANLQDKK